MGKGTFLSDQINLSVLENAAEGILIADVATRRFRYANPTVCGMFGYSGEQMLALSLEDILPPGDHARIEEVFAAQPREEFRFAAEVPCRRADGSDFFADINTSQVELGGKTYNVGFFTDISERVEKDHRLQQALRDWESIFQGIPHPTVIMDVENRILAANRQVERLVDGELKEALGKKCWEVFHGPGASCPPAGCPFQTMRKTGATATTEMEVQAAGGTYIVSCTPIMDKHGVMERAIHIATDISDHKRVEAELKESTAQYRELSNTMEILFDAIPDVLGVQDTRHNILRYNRAGYEFLNKTPEQVRGKRCFELIGRESPCEECATSQVYRTKQMARMERYFGDLGIWLDVRAYPVCDEDGELVRVIEHLRDITDVKRAQEDRLRLEHQQQLVQRLESLGVLAGGIAHDFNNLLGGIYGLIDLARTSTDAAEQRENLELAMTTIDRAKGLTRQLLTFAKGGAPARSKGRVQECVREAVKFALAGSNLSCTFDLPQDLRLCDFDPSQVGQVVENLVINAKHAMPRGGTLTISGADVDLAEGEAPPLPAGPYVRISIADQGVGIPEEVREKIFEPYFSTKQKGSGLGLAVVYSVMRRHDGCIQVESELDRGTTFHLLFPAAEADEARPQKNRAAVHRGGDVLVVDDEDVVRKVIADLLQNLGYRAECAADDREAIRLLTERRREGGSYTAVLVDLTIPGGMGGRELLLHLRRLDPGVPVFLVSGYSEDALLADPEAHGFSGSLGKPFTREDLSRLLGRVSGEGNPAPG